MGERFERQPEERRRRGPLGDAGDAEETRQVPRGGTQGAPGGADPGATRQIPPQGAEDKETRVIRTPGAPGGPAGGQEAAPYPGGYGGGYFEAAEEREDRLRDIYGGVDWLASFLGFVFSAVAAAVFSSVAGLVLVPLGVPLDLGSGEIGAAEITGLAVIALLVFLTFLFGGYVAGRLARFDGGRNGAMLLVWTFIAFVLFVVAGGILSRFLPAGVADGISNFIGQDLAGAIGGLSGLGVVGIAIAVGALLVALLGGFAGGRLGSRYHTEIDRTT